MTFSLFGNGSNTQTLLLHSRSDAIKDASELLPFSVPRTRKRPTSLCSSRYSPWKKARSSWRSLNPDTGYISVRRFITYINPAAVSLRGGDGARIGRSVALDVAQGIEV